MAVKWSTIVNDPDYIQLPESEKRKVKERYWQNVISKDEDFLALPESEKSKVYQKFWGHPETIKTSLLNIDNKLYTPEFKEIKPIVIPKTQEEKEIVKKIIGRGGTVTPETVKKEKEFEKIRKSPLTEIPGGLSTGIMKGILGGMGVSEKIMEKSIPLYKESKPKTKTGKIAETAGEYVGIFTSPLWGGVTGIGKLATTKIGETLVARKASRLLEKYIPKLAPHLTRIVKNAIAGGVSLGSIKTADELMKKAIDKDYSWKNVIKEIGLSIPEGMATFATMGELFYWTKAGLTGIKNRSIFSKARKTLGVKRSDNLETLKHKYRQLAKIYHPDVPKTGNAKKFREITEAYEILKEYYTKKAGIGLKDIKIPKEAKKRTGKELALLEAKEPVKTPEVKPPIAEEAKVSKPSQPVKSEVKQTKEGYKVIKPTGEEIVITNDLENQIINKPISEIRPELREILQRQILPDMYQEIKNWEFSSRKPMIDPETGEYVGTIPAYTTRPDWVRENWRVTDKEKIAKHIKDIIDGKENPQNSIVKYIKEEALARIKSGHPALILGMPSEYIARDIEAQKEFEKIEKEIENALKERRKVRPDTSKWDNEYKKTLQKLNPYLERLKRGEDLTEKELTKAEELENRLKEITKAKKKFIEEWKKTGIEPKKEPKPEIKPESETKTELKSEINSLKSKLLDKGFTKEQLNRATPETIKTLVEKNLKPEEVSILPSGELKVVEKKPETIPTSETQKRINVLDLKYKDEYRPNYEILKKGMKLVDGASSVWEIIDIDKSTGIPGKWIYTIKSEETGQILKAPFVTIERYYYIHPDFVTTKSKPKIEPKEVEKPETKAGWQPIEGYPKKGDYVKVEWKGKTYEGTITGDKPVRFRTGYVAREITTPQGIKKWMPWTSSAKYYIKQVKSEIKSKPEEIKPEVGKTKQSLEKPQDNFVYNNKEKIVRKKPVEAKIEAPTDEIKKKKQSLLDRYSEIPNEAVQTIFNTREYTPEKKLLLLNKIYKDPLTGLFRRDYYIDYQNDTGKRKITDVPLSKEPQVVLDIDHFKWFNDTYGHVVGDRILKVFGDIINDVIPNTAIRYGGEEIAIPLEGRTLEEIEQILQEIRKRFREVEIEINGKKIKGKDIVAFSETGEKQEGLNYTAGIGIHLKNADDMLYKGKELGRGINVYSEEVIKNEQSKEKTNIYPNTQRAGNRIRRGGGQIHTNKGILQSKNTGGGIPTETLSNTTASKSKVDTLGNATIRPSGGEKVGLNLGAISPESQILFNAEKAWNDIKQETFEKLKQGLEKLKNPREIKNKIKEKIDSIFVRYAGLPEELQRAFYIYEESFPQVIREIKNDVLREFGKYPKDVREYATLYLENPKKYPAEKSPDPDAVKELAEKADKFFKQKLQELKDIGQFSQEYEGYFQNKIKALLKEKEEIKKQMKEIDRLKHKELYYNLARKTEEIDAEITKTRNLRYVHHYVRNPKLKKKIYLWLRSGLIKGLRIKPKELIGRKFDTIDDLEDAGLEVEKDIAVIVARVARITWESKRNYEIINEIKKYKDFVLPTQEAKMNPLTAEWVELPEVASLRGYKVDPAIASAIRELIWTPQYRTPISKVGRILRKLNIAMKLARFIKPWIVGHNDIQQFFLGSSTKGKLKFLILFIKSLKDVYQKSELYKALERQGLYNKDYSFYRELLEEEIKGILEKRDKGILYVRLRRALEDIVNPIELVKDIRKGLETTTWFFDEVLRTALARDFIESGFSIPEASQKANDYMAWYNRLPKSTKYHINTYTFVGVYRSQMFRLYKNVIKDSLKGTINFLKGVMKGDLKSAFKSISDKWTAYRTVINWLIWKITVAKILWALGFSGAFLGYRYVKKLKKPKGLKYISLSGPVFEMPKYISRNWQTTVIYNLASLPGWFMAILYNKGWHGKQIYNPFDNWREQVLDIFLYTLETYFPLTTEIRNLKDREKTAIERMLQFLGIAYVYNIKELTPQQIAQMIKEVKLRKDLTPKQKYIMIRKTIKEYWKQRYKLTERMKKEFQK